MRLRREPGLPRQLPRAWFVAASAAPGARVFSESEREKTRMLLARLQSDLPRVWRAAGAREGAN
eukprot:9633515-Lingulodinium_polyedra.AAC.1